MAGALIEQQRPGRIVLVAPAEAGGRHRAADGADARTHVRATRAGLENLARTTSIEWARYGITPVTIATRARHDGRDGRGPVRLPRLAGRLLLLGLRAGAGRPGAGGAERRRGAWRSPLADRRSSSLALLTRRPLRGTARFADRVLGFALQLLAGSLDLRAGFAAGRARLLLERGLWPLRPCRRRAALDLPFVGLLFAGVFCCSPTQRKQATDGSGSGCMAALDRAALRMRDAARRRDLARHPPEQPAGDVEGLAVDVVGPR